MELGIAGKRAVVTAATSGLGLAIAERLTLEGASVSICGRDVGRLEEAASAIRKRTGREPVAMTCDVTSPESIAAYVESSAEALGGIDVLVANVGGPLAGVFTALGDEDWYDAIELNLMSAVRLVRCALPHMRARGGGAVLAVTSSSVKVPIPGLLLSNVLRPAVAALCKSLAEELAPFAVRVNAIAPGRIETARTAALDAVQAQRTGREPAQVRSDSEAMIPLGRYGTPEEFARVAAFYVSDAASYVTGATVVVDGGLIKAL